MNMATTGNTSVVFRRPSKVPICECAECAECMQNHTLNFAYFVAILGVKSLLIAMLCFTQVVITARLSKPLIQWNVNIMEVKSQRFVGQIVS